MTNEDTKLYSRSEVSALKARGEVRATPVDAPKLEPDKTFWEKARIVETSPKRKAAAEADTQSKRGES